MCACGEATQEQAFWADRLQGESFGNVPEFSVSASQGVTIDVTSNQIEEIPASSVIDRVRYVELEFSEKSMLGNIDFIRCNKEHIYVFSRGLVYCFDMLTGKFIYSLYNVGRGPNEVIRASDFDIDDNYIYVMDEVKVVVYSPPHSSYHF